MTWSTKDLWLATYLEVRGYEATHVEVRDRGVGYFVFGQAPEAQDLSDWINQKAAVEPMRFMQTQQELKNMLFRELGPRKPS